MLTIVKIVENCQNCWKIGLLCMFLNQKCDWLSDCVTEWLSEWQGHLLSSQIFVWTGKNVIWDECTAATRCYERIIWMDRMGISGPYLLIPLYPAKNCTTWVCLLIEYLTCVNFFWVKCPGLECSSTLRPFRTTSPRLICARLSDILASS